MIGSITVNVAPFPSPSLVALTVPPWSSTRCRTIARPNPMPPCWRLVFWSACLKRSKTCGRKSGEIPCPVSLTTISRCELIRSDLICTRPPRGVNLIAFDSKFQTTCWSLTGSPGIEIAPVSITFWTRTPFASAAGLTASTAASMNVFGSDGRTSMRNLPVMIRETSSRSSTSCACALALRSIVSRAFAVCSSESWPRRSIRAHPRIALNGVRSSCEMVARNSSFSTLDSSAWRYKRFCSVMSRAILEAPTISPLGPMIGETVSEMSISPPSLRTRTVS